MSQRGDPFKVGKRKEKKTISARLNCQVGPIDDCEPRNLLLLLQWSEPSLTQGGYWHFVLSPTIEIPLRCLLRRKRNKKKSGWNRWRHRERANYEAELIRSADSVRLNEGPRPSGCFTCRQPVRPSPPSSSIYTLGPNFSTIYSALTLAHVTANLINTSILYLIPIIYFEKTIIAAASNLHMKTVSSCQKKSGA